MPSSLSVLAVTGLVLASMPVAGKGAVLHLSLCGSGTPIEIPLGKDEPPSRHEGSTCVLACHADLGRRRDMDGRGRGA